MTKRAGGDSITLDKYDLQSLKFAQQLETGPFLTKIDHSVHDGHARNSLLSDPVVFCDGESVVNNVIQGSGKPCPSDCSTHAMIGAVRLPKRVLEADTIIVSCGLEILNILPGRSSTLTYSGDRTMNWLHWQTLTSSRKASRTTTLKSAMLVHYG